MLTYVTVVSNKNTADRLRLSISAPKDVSGVLGDQVRPEGTLDRGLIIHCNQQPIKGVTYTVDHASSTVDNINLPATYIHSNPHAVTHPKFRTPLTGEATIVDGQSVLILDRFDFSTIHDRTPRNYSGKAAPVDVNIDDLLPERERLKMAVQLVKSRVRDSSLAQAIITIAHLAARHGVELGWNGTEFTARIVQNL